MEKSQVTRKSVKISLLGVQIA